MQRKIFVITTFHGSDINSLRNRPFSFLAMKLSKHNIFVSQKIASRARVKRNFSVIPCGVDINSFYPVDKFDARKQLKMKENESFILFSNAFNNPIKNYPLAKSAVDLLNEKVVLLEFKGYTREQVNLLINACDVALMTSFSEGSPQFIKEAMACNRPVVCTDVGDVRERFKGIDGCFICSYEPMDVAQKIQKALQFKQTTAREPIKSLSNDIIAKKIVSVYQSIILK